MLAASPGDYLLNDYFGVNLALDNNGYFDPACWDPITGSMITDDWPTDGFYNAPSPGPRFAISEAFDIEAMYVDVDNNSQMVYFSIVTSMPDDGYIITENNWYPGYVFRAGDLRFDIGDETYVLGTFGHDTYHGYNLGGNLYYQGPGENIMNYYDGYRGHPDRGNPVLDMNAAPGHQVATTSAFQFDYHEYLDNGSPLIENGYATYVMEGCLSFAYFGGLDIGQTGLTMSLAMSCNNDQVSMSVDPVPEPATIALFSMGILGLAAARRKIGKR
jgi:hypothetical protein